MSHDALSKKEVVIHLKMRGEGQVCGVVKNLSQEPQHLTPKEKAFKMEGRFSFVERIDGIFLPQRYAETFEHGARLGDRVVGGSYALKRTMLVSRGNPREREKWQGQEAL